VATRDLRDELASIPGVSDAEITITDDERPTAVVWLDGTRGDEEVRTTIEALLGQSIPVVHSDEEPPPKRSGLGKGLDALLPGAENDPVPAQLLGDDGARAAAQARGGFIDRVAVVEDHGAVVVEVEDRLGNTYRSVVGDGGSIDSAVLDAVRQLVGAPDDLAADIVEVALDRPDLVIVEVTDGKRKAAGIAHIGFGRPYAVARAAHQAFTSL
jgi:hypothetical protein